MIADIPVVLTISSLLVFFGLFGAVRLRGDLMRVVLALQLVFLGALFNFALGSAESRDLSGIVFALLISCLTGVQLTACLTLFLLYFKRHKHLNSEQIDMMKG